MFPSQFLKCCRSRCLSCSTFYDPLRRLQQNRPNRHAQPSCDPGADLAFDLLRLYEKLFSFDFSHNEDLFCSEIGIVQSQCDDPPIMSRRMAGDNLLDILRIQVLSADNDEIFLASDDKELAVEEETEI